MHRAWFIFVLMPPSAVRILLTGVVAGAIGNARRAMLTLVIASMLVAPLVRGTR